MGFDIIKISFWASFIVSTPACLYAVFFMGQNRDLYSIINSYGFSIGMVGMYFYPLLNIFSGKKFFDRLNEATFTWILFLSVLTAIVFQIPHNLFPVQLNSVKGTMFEWAFASYAKSDSRWNNYTATKEYGLAAEVWLINWNDSILALIVLFFFILYKVYKGNNKFKLIFVLSVLFRDTTLFRETVEYMWDHHRKGYLFSTSELLYRNHAIACLWLVNITWLVAPLLSFVWAYYQIAPIVGKNKKD